LPEVRVILNVEIVLPFLIPPPAGCEHVPVWTGRGFRLGNTVVPILSYDVSVSGWTDDLTTFSEENGGGGHYMNVASRANAIRALRTHVVRPDPALMDIGCSSGFMLKDLRAAFPASAVLGSDYVRGPLDSLARSNPEIPLLQFDLTQCPLPAESLDGITLLNVLEHVEDDLSALQHVFRILKPGGIAVIEVPAGPKLFDVYDKYLMHFRRYRMSELLLMLRSAGFEILERSHLGFFIYPAFAAVKKRNRRYLAADPTVQRKIVASNNNQATDSRIIHGIMRAESIVRHYISLPIGIRCVVTVRRPEGANGTSANG
jgi:SAM-dependent methyltransferase